VFISQCTYSIPIDKAGFYVIAVQLPADESEGMWGFSANTSGGRNVGGFNAGTVIEGNGALPGFMGFYLDAPEAVQIQLFDYSATPSSLKMTLSDSNRTPIQTHLFNSGDSITTQSLAAGFYVASVETSANSLRTRFGIAVTGSNLSGGVKSVV
jgi:hypothetical protein